MKKYTAINSEGIQYSFQAISDNYAKDFCRYKFNIAVTDITIRNDETGEEFPLIDEWLSDSAFVSQCMESGNYNLFILNTWDGKHKNFAPVIEVTKEIVPETVKNDYNEIILPKTTHKCGDWYIGFKKGQTEDSFFLKYFCEEHGHLTFEEL